MKLQNKTAIITGAGSGIGEGIANLFAKEGARVVVANRRVENGERVVSEIKNSGGQAVFIQTDVSKWEDWENLSKKTIEIYGGIDILVNNAGVVKFSPLHQTSDEDWDYILNINLKGAFYGMKAVIPQMLKQGKGKIINISSIAGLVGFDKLSAYCASKGGIIALTREAGLEYAKDNININCIAPGVIVSEMTRGLLDDEKTKQGFLINIPLGRIGQPNDIGYCALYLASDDSNYITGQVFVIDGGWTIR